MPVPSEGYFIAEDAVPMKRKAAQHFVDVNKMIELAANPSVFCHDREGIWVQHTTRMPHDPLRQRQYGGNKIVARQSGLVSEQASLEKRQGFSKKMFYF